MCKVAVQRFISIVYGCELYYITFSVFLFVQEKFEMTLNYHADS